jgi:hypothetical protein
VYALKTVFYQQEIRNFTITIGNTHEALKQRRKLKINPPNQEPNSEKIDAQEDKYLYAIQYINMCLPLAPSVEEKWNPQTEITEMTVKSLPDPTNLLYKFLTSLLIRRIYFYVGNFSKLD